MTTVSAKEAKERFGALIEAAQRGPVAIERHGRRVAVLVHAEEFDRLEALEDAYWGEKARAAAKKGFSTAKESAEYLHHVLRKEKGSISVFNAERDNNGEGIPLAEAIRALESLQKGHGKVSKTPQKNTRTR